MANEIIADGILDFSGGVNSLIPPTVSSPQNPNGLHRNQLAWLTNATCRGTGITCRTGWQFLCRVTDGTTLYQGGLMYLPRAALPYLILSIGGRILRVRVDLSVPTIDDILAASDTNPLNEPQAFFQQGEEFVIIQAGDNTTLPLFWDGQTLRRSNGSAQNFGTTAVNFIVPAVGSVVQVTLASPYLGPPNQQVLINNKQYQVISGNSLTKVTTLTNRGDFPAGKNYPQTDSLVVLTPDLTATSTSAVTYDGTHWNVNVTNFPTVPIGNTGHGYFNWIFVFWRQASNTLIRMFGVSYGSPQSTQLLNSPIGSTVFTVKSSTIVGAFTTGFSVPGINATVQTVIDKDYSGPFGVPAVISLPNSTNGISGLYEITSVGYPPLPPNDILLINLGDTPGATVTLGNTLTTVPELPAATAMDYFMGRLWYAQGRLYIAGDIVRGPSGSLPYEFRDSILKITENPLALGGDGFTVPSEAGNIRALKHTAEMDTTLGQGKLYIFTANPIYRLDVPVSRTQWIAASDATQPLQLVVQLNYGSVNDRCIVNVNSDLFYQTLEPGIRSLALAQRLFNVGQWGNVPISRNEQRILRFNDRALSRFSSGIEFDNRLWETALPKDSPCGVVSQAVVPLDFDLISTLEEKRPPAWEGMYEGLDILQMFKGDFGGRQRAFGVVRSKIDGSIQIWEFTDFLRTDINANNEETRITWIVELPSLTWNDVFLLKRLVGGELWVDRVAGEVVFKVEYRPDGDACWHFWHEWKICSARNSCEDVVNPICYPITPFAEGYREVMGLPMPIDECQTTMGRPVNIGFQFQARITVKGWCRIRGFVMYAQPFDKNLYNALICPGLTPEPSLAPAQPGQPLSQAVIPNVAALIQQVVPSVMPTVPVAGVILVSTVVPPILDPGVDPPVIVGPLVFDILMEIQVDGSGNTVLTWNNILGLPSLGLLPISDLQIDRSDDNINYFGFIHWVQSGPATEDPGAHWIQITPPTADLISMPSSFSDSHVPPLNFFWRLTAQNQDRSVVAIYNVVSRTTSYTLSGVGNGITIQLNWDAPVL